LAQTNRTRVTRKNRFTKNRREKKNLVKFPLVMKGGPKPRKKAGKKEKEKRTEDSRKTGGEEG